MIKSIHICNFQSHKDSFIEFSKGLNIIKGSSHNGKSSIIRALKWCLENKPKGDGFKSSFASEKDDVKVTIVFTDGSTISRIKGKDNSYEIAKNGKTKVLKALGSGVPDEVLAISKMNELNLQSQGDGYFMLGDSPGKRAKDLNKIVGLEIIDESLKKINSQISTNNTILASVKEDIENIEIEISKYSNTEDILKMTNGIDYLYVSLSKTLTESGQISDLKNRVKQEQENIELIGNWLEVENGLIKIENIYNEYNVGKESRKILGDIVSDYNTEKENITIVSNWLKVEKELGDIEGLLVSNTEQRSELSNLKKIWNDISSHNKNKKDNEIKIKEIKKQLDKIGTCPLCNQPVGDWI